jgi:hypothetical protein
LDPGAIRDKIEYKVKTSNKGISVKVVYKEEYEEEEGVDEYTDTSTEFEVKFDSIVEYKKDESATNNGEEASADDEAYDWDQDEILQTLELNEWQNFSTVMSDEEGVVSYFSATSLDDVATFNFTISRADIGEKVTANTMKIDVHIIDFPWMRNDTYLALLSSVNSKLKVEMTYDEAAMVMNDHDGSDDKKPKHKPMKDFQISFEEATGDIGFVPFGEYKWEDLADVYVSGTSLPVLSDGQPIIDITTADNIEIATTSTTAVGKIGANNATSSPEELDGYYYTGDEVTETIQVVATSPEQIGNETFQLLAYSFVGSAAHNASDIYWDPEAGIRYQSGAATIIGSLASVSAICTFVNGLILGGLLLLSF